MGNCHSGSKRQSQTEATTMEERQDTQCEAGTTPPHKDEDKIKASLIYQTIDQINAMKVFKGRMHVTTPSGTIAYCYLDTHGMPMRYLTRNETIVDGNLSLNWILGPPSIPPTKPNDSKYLSNAVTAGTNTKKQERAYLNIIKTDGEEVPFVLGPCKTTITLVKNPNAPSEANIYTSAPGPNYYLAPTDDGRIIAQTGAPKYPFKFPAK